MVDASSSLKMVESLDEKISVSENIVRIKKNAHLKTNLTYHYNKIAFTPLILASLLVRKRKCSVPLPGGCKIDNRN